MLGIENIGIYVPSQRISNYDRKSQFKIDDNFIAEKIGVKSVSIKEKEDETSDLCLKAFDDLCKRTPVNKDEIEAAIVVTQNPDLNIPHTSAIVHSKLELPKNCACFDISLGCSGFVYALSVLLAFMKENEMQKGLLFTADPYSKVVDPEDKNTSLLFGDGAAVVLISETPQLVPGKFTFGTMGKEHENLIARNGTLYMNGRAVFNFAAKTVPDDMRRMLDKNNLRLEEIDRFLLHQGSKIIVETIAKKLDVPLDKVPYSIYDYGNTIASTIPILLQPELDNQNAKTFAISGFGVGLSWGSGVLHRVE